MTSNERWILLHRLQKILKYVAWDELQLKKIDDLRKEVHEELHKIAKQKGSE